MKHESVLRGWPVRGWTGLGLVGIFWILNWSLDGLRTHWGFFPLWLGYCLAVDAAAYHRTGTSLWSRSRRGYVGLFLLSAPAWWLFEAINWRTANWQYEGRGEFTDLEYFLLASISFSTVLPAVFGTAELASSCGWLRRLRRSWSFRVTIRTRLTLATTGLLMMALALVWPRYCFPFVWVSLAFLLDPLNDALGRPSLLREVSRGEWRAVAALATGGLICGLFWEFWNYYSYPKWTYDIPYFDFLRIFEMPLMGYGGYIPFSMELFALYHLLAGVAFRKTAKSYVRLKQAPDA